jgi:membrane dipeptidase
MRSLRLIWSECPRGCRGLQAADSGVGATRWLREGVDVCAARLGISREAAELFAHSDVIDLHIDSFIWRRVFGYRLERRHSAGILGARYTHQVDFPRLREVGISGATWVITTNPFRSARGRSRALLRNLVQLEALLDQFPGDFRRVSCTAEYRKAVAEGCHAAFIGIQGGNAFATDLQLLSELDPARLLRVTLTHLTNSGFGQTSSPLGHHDTGLSPQGFDLVACLNDKRIFVDLAHINRRGFFEALEQHRKDLPPIVTHTGVSSVRAHWRNLDDDQVRAIAARGGTIGIMFHAPFLAPGFRRPTHDCVAEHILHVIALVGDDFVSLGSDWDGAITTPRDMPTCLELPRLVDTLLRRGLPVQSIQKLLGQNFLRTLSALRG